MNIGIIGQGFVGFAIYSKFKSYYNVLTYDIIKKLSNSSFEDIVNECKIIFICLPTPMNRDGSCDFSLVDKILFELNSKTNATILIKSTVVPGTSEYFAKKNKNLKIIFNPEFLTEKNSVSDYSNLKRIILGGNINHTNEVKHIFEKVFKNAEIVQIDSKSAEVIKYFTNCFLATKVSLSNEFYKLCTSIGVNYDKIVDVMKLDDRIGKSHLSVPGPDGDYGFGGHCFPKDLNAIIKLMTELNISPHVLNGSLRTNDDVRNNRNWEKMVGRAVN